MVLDPFPCQSKASCPKLLDGRQLTAVSDINAMILIAVINQLLTIYQGVHITNFKIYNTKWLKLTIYLVDNRTMCQRSHMNSLCLSLREVLKFYQL